MTSNKCNKVYENIIILFANKITIRVHAITLSRICSISCSILFVTCFFMLTVYNDTVFADSTISGSIFDKQGKPIEGVQIYSFSADLKVGSSRNGNISKFATATVKSNPDGIYSIIVDSTVKTTIIGNKKDLWFYRTISPNNKTPVIDTLKECGNLQFYLNLEKSDQHDLVVVSLIGTPFSARSDKKGAVTFNCISPGSYQAILNSSRPGYQDVLCSLRIVESENDIFPDTIIVPYIGKNRITFTKTFYDTSKGTISLSWDSNTSNENEYLIIRDIGVQSKPGKVYATTNNRYFNDTLLSLQSKTQGFTFTDKNQYPISYIVTIKPNKKAVETIADTVRFAVSPLKKAMTQSPRRKDSDSKEIDSAVNLKSNNMPFVNAGNDTTVGIKDVVNLKGTANVKDGTIILWEWSIDNTPFLTSVDGSYSITTPPKTDTLTAILKVTANNGNQASDTLIIYSESSPPKAHAGGDSVTGIFDTIHLSGSADDNGSIISMGWDIGNSGNFTPTKDGSALIYPIGTPVEALMCIFRAIDDDGEKDFDTVFVSRQIQWKELTPSPEFPERKGHALVNFNGMLWIIGGSLSDIWNSPDGIHWQQIVESAPFGVRFGHSATAFNGELFVIGGKGPDDSYTNTIWSSSDGKNWRKQLEADFLQRHYHSVTQFKDRLWIIGGLGESGYEACLNDIWSSEDGKKWKPEGDTALFSRRYGHGAVVLNDALIITGGLYEGFSGTQTLHDTWSSTNGTDWKQISDSLAVNNKKFYTFLESENRIWSIGGYCSTCSKSTLFATIRTTTDGSSWISHNQSHQTGSYTFCAGAVFNNRIFISPSDIQYLLMLQ